MNKAHAKWSFDEKQPNENGKFVAKMVCILSTAYVEFTLNLEIPLAFLISFHFLSTTIFGTSKVKQRWRWNSEEFPVLTLMQTHFNIQQSKGTVMWTFCLLEMTLIGRICVTCSCGIFAEFRVHFDSMLLPSIFINCRFFIWFGSPLVTVYRRLGVKYALYETEGMRELCEGIEKSGIVAFLVFSIRPPNSPRLYVHCLIEHKTHEWTVSPTFDK